MNYYLVPVTNNHTYLNGVKLNFILKTTYPEVYKIEETKNNIYSKINFDINEYKIINNKVKKLYDRFYIPNYLIVKEENGVYNELVSGSVVTTDKLADLEIHEVTLDMVNDYFVSENYTKRFTLLYDNFLFYRASVLKNELEKKSMKLKREK